MREVTGNIWEIKAEAIVIPTNGAIRRDGACVMGRGLALQAARRYPGLPYVLGSFISKSGNQVYHLGKWFPYEILSFPVKHHWREKADLELIRRSVGELQAKSEEYEISQILLPRVGCSNGQLDWEDVKPLLSGLDWRFTVVSLPEEV